MALGPHAQLSIQHEQARAVALYPAIAMISLSLLMTLAGLAYLRGAPSRGAKDFTIFWRGPRTGWKKLAPLPRDLCSTRYREACERGDLDLAALWLSYLTVQSTKTSRDQTGLYVHMPSPTWVEAVTRECKGIRKLAKACLDFACPLNMLHAETEATA
jgi:hypothetical protein